MIRAVIRNLMLALTVGLPVLITCGAAIAWLFPPTWADGHGLPVSASGFAGGFVFWYLILALPVAGFALVHQLALILATDRGRRSPQRVHSVVTALAMSVCVAFAIGVSSTEVNWPALLGTLLISSAVYAFVARPLPTPGRSRDAAG